jgi:hypothetical protein
MRGNPDKGPQKQDYDLGYGNAGKGPEQPYFPSAERGNEYNSHQATIVKRDQKRVKSDLRRKY